MRKIKVLVSSLLLAMLMVTTVPVLEMDVQAETAQEKNIKLGYKGLTKIDLGETDEEIETNTLMVNRYAASTWDMYSSKYFYNQMSSAQKQLYNSIYNTCMSYLTTTANAEVYSSESGLTAPILAPAGMSQEDAVQVVFVIITNNPQFYFLNEMYGMGTAANGNYVQIGMYPQWVSGTTRMAATSQISNKITSWMNQINTKTDIIEKEKMAHDLIVSNTEYDYANYNQSCAGVFLEGKAVCAGYAEAFALLCNGIGINTVSVTSAEHEWNIVQLHGKWYNVDCTWDDRDDGRIYYDYFNTSDKTISEGYHVIEGTWEGFTIPACSSDTVPPIYNGIDYSAVYDEAYYVNKYSDVKKAFGNDSVGILTHFINYGMKEGRQGNSSFSVQSYRNQYADLRRAFGNDLKSYYMHYIQSGKREGRAGTGCNSLQGVVTVYNGVDYSAVYNFNEYITRYADIKRIYGNDDVGALAHFVNSGMKEGRQGSSSFSVQSYRNQYADLRRAFGNDLKSYYMHYIQSGRREGRAGTGCNSLQGAVTVYNGVDYAAVYNFNEYITRYADIKRIYGNDDVGALAHFVNSGMKEGRQGSSSFSVQSYRNQYADLRRAFGNDLKSYYMHYIQSGRREGRAGTGCNSLQGAVTVYNGVDYAAVYNFNEYITRYADIKRIYGNDDVGALAHFVNSGMKEGRQASTEFNVNTYRNRYADLQRAFGNDLKSYYIHYIRNGKAEGRSGK